MYQLLLEQNPWWGKVSIRKKIGVIRPKYLEQLKKHNNSDFISILTGIRRAGKSTLFYQDIDTLIQNGIPSENILYFNFFYIRKDLLKIELFDSIYNTYTENIPIDTKHKIFIFFDEIQEVRDFESWIIKFHELNKGEVKIFLTGSSSGLSSSEISTYFTGRNITLKVFPLDFKEFLSFQKINLAAKAGYNELFSTRNVIKSALVKYMKIGGFPEAVLDPENLRSIMASFIGDIIYRDIIKPYGIDKAIELEGLANYLLGNSTNLFSYRKTSRSVGISYETVRKYIAAFEKASLFYRLPPFSLSRLITIAENISEKIYVADIGFMNYARISFSENYGPMAENLVFNYLNENFRQTLGYYRDPKSEIDFIFLEQDKTILIQVTYTDDINGREEKSLLLNQNKFTNPRNYIITKDIFTVKDFSGVKINYIPMWYFLIAGITYR